MRPMKLVFPLALAVFGGGGTGPIAGCLAQLHGRQPLCWNNQEEAAWCVSIPFSF